MEFKNFFREVFAVFTIPTYIWQLLICETQIWYANERLKGLKHIVRVLGKRKWIDVYGTYLNIYLKSDFREANKKFKNIIP